MPIRTLTLFVRQHCHLCTEMARALAPYRARYGFGLELVDIDDDPVLRARYGEKVPVLAEGEQEICIYFLKDEAITAHLGKASRGDAAVRDAPVNERIYAIVRQIPPGKVATYGQVAVIEGHSTARMVGNAMANLPAGSDVPWQRVLNARGSVSPRKGGGGTSPQKQRLLAEGVVFGRADRVDFSVVGWDGPSARWLKTNGCRSAPRAGVPARKREHV